MYNFLSSNTHWLNQINLNRILIIIIQFRRNARYRIYQTKTYVMENNHPMQHLQLHLNIFTYQNKNQWIYEKNQSVITWLKKKTITCLLYYPKEIPLKTIWRRETELIFSKIIKAKLNYVWATQEDIQLKMKSKWVI